MDLIDGFKEIRKKGRRYVQCGVCNSKVYRSIVPHVRSQHPDLWEKWLNRFNELRAEGKTYKQIMWEFKRLFSWNVIRREIFPNDPILFAEVDVKKFEPTDIMLEEGTLWRFPRRGDWATHTRHYPGNWPPQVPRNLILRYSKANELVLDPFVGGGTTLIECLLLGRRGIGVDVNPSAVKATQKRIQGLKAAAKKQNHELPKVKIVAETGNAKNLHFVRSNSVDLICTHPPYLNIIKYTKASSEDLSRIRDVDEYLNKLRKAVREFYRVLKPGKVCALMIGDVKKNGSYVPLGFQVCKLFEEEGFEVHGIVVKEQEKCSNTEFYLNSNFLRITHEYIFIFRK